jgi:putative membrane protein
MKTVTTFASFLVLGLVGFVAAADVKPKDLPEPKTDSEFLVQAVTMSNADMRLSEQASRNASDPKVKEFADRMVKEHKQLDERLAEQGRNLKVAVLAGNEEETKAKLDQLGKLKGADYDRAYVQMMVEDHERAAQLFDGYSKNAKDPGLKTFSTDATKSIKEHLDEARKLFDGLKK